MLAINKNLLELNSEKLFEVSKNSLIREKIKINELSKYYDLDQEVSYLDEILKDFYTNLKLENEEQLKIYFFENNVNLEDVKKKLNIESLWNKLIFEKYSNQVEIDEAKMRTKIKKQIDQSNKTREYYFLSELMFASKNKDDMKNQYSKILDSIQKIGFNNTANIYSIADSAKFGGKIGWIAINQLSSEIFNKIKDLEIGEYSTLINTPGGSLILQLDEKKIENIEIDFEKELKELLRYEKDKQLNQFSSIYFKKIEKSTLINEK